MSEFLDVAVVQLNSADDVAENLRAVGLLVEQAASGGARLVVLPENFAFFGSDAERAAFAEPIGDLSAPIQGALSSLARKHRVVLVGGGFPEASGDGSRPYNTCAVFSDQGNVLGAYRKIHLFDVDLSDGTRLTESRVTTAGGSTLVVDVDGFGIGLSICYDLRFPELYRRLVDEGAQVLLVPAAFTAVTGRDHWHVLLRTRAIEAQCFVAAAAQAGSHPRGRETYGHSALIDPWGTIMAEVEQGTGVALARLERARLLDVRRRLPSLDHRRL